MINSRCFTEYCRQEEAIINASGYDIFAAGYNAGVKAQRDLAAEICRNAYHYEGETYICPWTPTEIARAIGDDTQPAGNRICETCTDRSVIAADKCGGAGMDLIEGLQNEIRRNRNLVKIYNEVPNGAFASIMINQDIVDAERAMAEADTVAMLRLFDTLQNNSDWRGKTDGN